MYYVLCSRMVTFIWNCTLLFSFILQKFGSTIHNCGSCIYIILKIIPLFSCTLLKVGVNDLVKYVTVLLPLEVT